jgi:NAD(P)H dehydrogenase (quinone)
VRWLIFSIRFLLLLAATLPAVAQAAGATRILVAYYSDTGNTRKMAEAVRDGAASVSGISVVLRPVKEASDEDIRTAAGILLGTPVHWENVSAGAKLFLDRVGAVLGKTGKDLGEGRTAGAFCTGGAPAAGKDLTRLSVLAAFLAMRFVTVGGVDAEGFGTLGAEATTGPADPGLSAKELDEARRFGRRFAEITLRLRGANPPVRP